MVWTRDGTGFGLPPPTPQNEPFGQFKVNLQDLPFSLSICKDQNIVLGGGDGGEGASNLP